ncbi:MAG: phospholipid carrier-dependent glycosyltransferase [Holosporaceae bacterium]|jgi:4-amino-4-deoxy-L-arabinose transferase-like glycosyltransferase|nr:phospholipid carrier-dependent glycosyltransferase [Holosporaceae bacterium]
MSNLSLSEKVRGFFALALVLSIFFAYDMGIRRFADPDEGRYVEIPREMVVTGDYVTPRLNGLKYFEKPVLFYWMQAASQKIFGLQETSMRLWTVIFAVLGCLMVCFMGSRYYSNTIGVASAGILATSLLYYAHSRLIIIDLVLSVFMSGALWCFFAAFVKKNPTSHESPPKSSQQKAIIVGMYVLSALACLTKGLIGMVLPAFVAFLWILFTKNWKKIPQMLYLPGIFSFLLVFLPWHICVMKQNDDFFHFYFVVEHFLRYTTTMHDRYQPVWFFLPVLLLGFAPWTGFSLIAIKNGVVAAWKKKSTSSENVFFLCWIGGILGFFSFSGSKLIPYILPLLQPLALITGIYIVKSLESRSGNLRIGALLNIFLFAIMAAAYFFLKPTIADVLQDHDAITLIHVLGAIALAAMVTLLAVAYPKYLKISPLNALLVFLFLAANMMWVINKGSVYYQDVRKPSTKKMAEFVRLNKNPDDEVFCYDRYYQDFPVYANSTVSVVNFVGELEFGANAEKDKKVLWQEDEFWEFWNTTEKRIFLLMTRDKYKKIFATKTNRHNILDFDENFVVISNK